MTTWISNQLINKINQFSFVFVVLPNRHEFVQTTHRQTRQQTQATPILNETERKRFKTYLMTRVARDEWCKHIERCESQFVHIQQRFHQERSIFLIEQNEFGKITHFFSSLNSYRFLINEKKNKFNLLFQKIIIRIFTFKGKLRSCPRTCRTVCDDNLLLLYKTKNYHLRIFFLKKNRFFSFTADRECKLERRSMVFVAFSFVLQSNKMI